MSDDMNYGEHTDQTAEMGNPTGERQYLGRAVIDERGTKIGTVTDVLPDDETGEPAWVVVSMGLLRSEHFVPLSAAYQSEQGRLVLPFDREMVKHSPKAKRDHVLERGTATELRRYYQAA
jgi:hypothetical protein